VPVNFRVAPTALRSLVRFRHMQDLDRAQQTLYDAHWSTGDTAVQENGKLVWHVYCHRGEQKLVARGQSRIETWQAAVRMAVRLER
jgi:hypothetical protein